tara:strand:+ start:4040 stop:4501 length:462 start_codon:yes stop_codon:yes gene_type:complete
LIHHGFEKLNNIQNFAEAFLRPINIPFPIMSAYFASACEIIGSWLLIIGFFTRLGAIGISLTIGGAIYHAIYTSGLNIYLLELLLLYEASCLSILFLGPGYYSIDHLISIALSKDFENNEKLKSKKNKSINISNKFLASLIETVNPGVFDDTQ